MKLKSYKHIPLKEADKLYNDTKKIKLKVTTINWTYATETRNKIRKQYYDKVHINIYETTLPKLIKFIQELKGIEPNGETYCIAEDVVKIEVL
jgi:hypothetical protein